MYQVGYSYEKQEPIIIWLHQQSSRFEQTLPNQYHLTFIRVGVWHRYFVRFVKLVTVYVSHVWHKYAELEEGGLSLLFVVLCYPGWVQRQNSNLLRGVNLVTYPSRESSLAWSFGGILKRDFDVRFPSNSVAQVNLVRQSSTHSAPLQGGMGGG